MGFRAQLWHMRQQITDECLLWASLNGSIASVTHRKVFLNTITYCSAKMAKIENRKIKTLYSNTIASKPTVCANSYDSLPLSYCLCCRTQNTCEWKQWTAIITELDSSSQHWVHSMSKPERQCMSADTRLATRLKNIPDSECESSSVCWLPLATQQWTALNSTEQVWVAAKSRLTIYRMSWCAVCLCANNERTALKQWWQPKK